MAETLGGGDLGVDLGDDAVGKAAAGGADDQFEAGQLGNEALGKAFLLQDLDEGPVGEAVFHESLELFAIDAERTLVGLVELYAGGFGMVQGNAGLRDGGQVEGQGAAELGGRSQ